MIEEKILKDATLCLLVKNGEVCLPIKKHKIGAGCRMGYGGGIEEGETPTTGALRELREECGVEALESNLQKIALCHFRNQTLQGEIFVCTVHVFLVSKWVGTPSETDEMGKPQWFPIESLPLEKLMLADPYWLPQVLKGEKIEVWAGYGPHQKILIGEVIVKSLTS
ncbi:MAG: hypothetical protein RJA61_538 [Candidatus Parcubacteria bacterium]|jgi:ADP-ribose pyrophosphatase YjhB (NUDIX family)